MTTSRLTVVPVELVRLHNDIVCLLQQMVSTALNTQKYLQIKWGPRSGKVLETTLLEKDRKPEQEVAPDFMEKTSDEIDSMLKLANSIDGRKELFDWFAAAYSEWPSEISYFAGQASRHGVAAEFAVKAVRCVDKLRREGWPYATPKKFSLEEYRRRRDDRSRPDCPNCLLQNKPALNEELSRAVRICTSRLGQPADPRDAERDEWLYRQWQELNKTWAQILAEYEGIRSSCRWPKIASINGLRERVRRYAKINGLPLRKGHGGRPRIAGSH